MPRKYGSQGGSPERRITIPVPQELSDRIDAAVHGRPGETLKSLILRAVESEIDHLEVERGSAGVSLPFPVAPGRPPPGRPRKNPGADAVAMGDPPVPPAADSSAEVERLMHVLEQREVEEPLLAKGRSAGRS
ncbi:MAG: hypothetical protein P8R42_18900 [Candidatus Binatia bacterium]|nr:hypothetical protein [Candidatus Binatia bacterium]